MTNLKVVRILAIGDVVGSAGCLCLEACLPKIKQQYKIDIVIANTIAAIRFPIPLRFMSLLPPFWHSFLLFSFILCLSYPKYS